VNALAYTVGNDIVFAAGQYAPRAASRQRLLAHELAHVAQQSVGPRANPNLRLASPTHRGGLEANSAARQVLADSQPPAMASVPPMVQRFTASLGSGDKVLIHPVRSRNCFDYHFAKDGDENRLASITPDPDKKKE
jgi:hypothetical protein